jgi:hypothetical protein
MVYAGSDGRSARTRLKAFTFTIPQRPTGFYVSEIELETSVSGDPEPFKF